MEAETLGDDYILLNVLDAEEIALPASGHQGLETHLIKQPGTQPLMGSRRIWSPITRP